MPTRTILPSSMPAVDPQIRSRHKATRVADQEHRRTTILVGLAQLAQHILRRPIPFPLWKLLKQRFHHGCDNIAGRDGVDTDAVRAPLGGEIA